MVLVQGGAAYNRAVGANRHPDISEEQEELRRLWAELGDAAKRAQVEASITAVQDRIRTKWEGHYESLGLSIRGRSKTEARLRELYARANDDDNGEIARFLSEWKSKRGLKVADDWMRDNPPIGAYCQILWRYALCDGMETVDRFLTQLKRDDLDDDRRDDVVDRLSDLINLRPRHARYQECLAVIAEHLRDKSPEVRWTAAFSLGKLGAKEYRDELVALAEDKTNCRYGYVSAVARSAVRLIDGELDVDLHDASEP